MQASTTRIAALSHRALIRVSGPDWAPFLKGLCTAHIDRISHESSDGSPSSLHYGAFLRPQGKMYADCLIQSVAPDDIRLDVPLSAREELLAKLNMYKLRAKVTILPLDLPVFAAFGGALPEGFSLDPRAEITGAKFGMAYGERKNNATVYDWATFRYSLGLAEGGYDFEKDELYAIDANLDLLDAIDFKKGCYVGQELTSRMKRRGQIKNRVLPFRYQNHPPEREAEILNGELRAGQVLAANDNYGLALMRLDRMKGELHDSFGQLEVYTPSWMLT